MCRVCFVRNFGDAHKPTLRTVGKAKLGDLARNT